MRINRTNPEQPAAQPVQNHAPLKAQTEVNGFELPEQEIPKENQKEPPKAAKPPKPKKEKPAKKPRRQPGEEVEDDEENEQPRRRFPFGCLIVLVILALVGFGGYKVSQFYAELDGQKTLGPTQTITVPEGSSVASIATQLKDAGVIEYDWLFKQYVKYSGKAGEIQYGDFEVQSGMAYNDIIKALSVVTRRATVNVTIPEGTTAVGVAQIFVDAGLVDDDATLDKFCRLYVKTAQSAELLALWNVGAEREVIRGCDATRFTELRALEPYYHARPWSAALAGKRVLVVHPFRRTILAQYEKRAQLFPGKDVLPELACLTVIQAVQGLGGQDTGYADWFDALTEMERRMDDADYDVAIVGAGAYSLPLAAHARDTGHAAIQMSGATQLLFGIKGKRWDDHPVISKLYNPAWVRPDETEGISNKEKVEGGSYW